ncbi:MAG: hypothetical protein PHZ26_00930 [Candidatus Gracilibacteria bacterium]|nr:hypothetical protein [Candidatus Gracilibacteria bacterium]MDD2908298.1 hypothetical protein [Candidatus Gracilibacteria bacterium]
MEEKIFNIESKPENNENIPLENQNIINNISNEDTTNNVDDLDFLNIDLSQNLDTKPKEKKGFLSFLHKKNKLIEEKVNNSNEDIGIISTTDNDVLTDNSLNDSIIGETINNSNGDIFQDFDLGDLSFLEESGDSNIKNPFNPLEFTKKLSGSLFWLTLILSTVFYVNVLVLTSDSDFIHSIPGVCDYIGTKIPGYNNTNNCLSIPKILEEQNKTYEKLESNILKSLVILIPKKIQTDYIISSPEVQFINSKHTSDKIFINKIFKEFEDLRTSNKPFNGLNIECSNYRADESGLFELSCIFYGASITSISDGQEVKTSRTVAIDFLKLLNSSNSRFKILNYPNNLSIQESNSTDGIKSRFTTQTSIPLKLQYSLTSKL